MAFGTSLTEKLEKAFASLNMLEVFRPAFAAVFADIVESPLKFIETLVNRLSGSFWLSLRCVTKQHDNAIRTLILRSVVAIPRFQCEDSVARGRTSTDYADYTDSKPEEYLRRSVDPTLPSDDSRWQ